MDSIALPLGVCKMSVCTKGVHSLLMLKQVLNLMPVFPPVFSWMGMWTASKESLWMKWEGANPWRGSCVSKRLSSAVGSAPTGGVGLMSLLSAHMLWDRISGKMAVFPSELLEMFCMHQLINASPHMGNKSLPLFWKWLTELKAG